MSNAVVELLKLGKRYGRFHAVADVTLDLPAGAITGLVGHNGAGKSTLFKLILGLIRADAGEVRLFGRRVDGRWLREARRQIGWLPENLALFDNLSARETLEFFARLKQLGRIDAESELAAVGLAHAIDQRVQTFSKGMRQRLGLAQALLGTPQLLLLDEPTNGLDPEGVRDLYTRVELERARGCTVLVSSHILAELEQRVSHLAVMRQGQLAAFGRLQDLRAASALPVHIELHHSAPEALGAQLAALQLPLLQSPAAFAGGLRLSVSRDNKLPVMARLSPLLADCHDLRVLDAPLEQLLLGAGT